MIEPDRPSPESISGLILDFDGVLVDTEACALQAWSLEYAAAGVSFPVGLWRSLQGRSDSRDVLVAELCGAAASATERTSGRTKC
jgi:beta-phosphoglucomutase-like phosphatase (HAD superfamily)